MKSIYMTTFFVQGVVLLSSIPVGRCQGESSAVTTTRPMDDSQTSQNPSFVDQVATNSSLDTLSPLDSDAPTSVDTIVPTRAPVETIVNNTFILNNAMGWNASQDTSVTLTQILSKAYTDYVMQQVEAFFEALASGDVRRRRLAQRGIEGSIEYMEGSAMIDTIQDIDCLQDLEGVCQQVYASFSVLVDTAGADRRGYVYVLSQEVGSELFLLTQTNIASMDGNGGLAMFMNATDDANDLKVFAVPEAPSMAPSQSPSLVSLPTTPGPTATVQMDTAAPSISSNMDTSSPITSPAASPMAVLTFGSSPTSSPTAALLMPQAAAAATLGDAPTGRRKPLVAGMTSLLCIALSLCVFAAIMFARRQKRNNQAKTRAVNDHDDFSIASISITKDPHGSVNIADAYLCEGELRPLGMEKQVSPEASLRNLALFDKRPDNCQGYETTSHVQFLARVLSVDLPRQSSRGLVGNSNGSCNEADGLRERQPSIT